MTVASAATTRVFTMRPPTDSQDRLHLAILAAGEIFGGAERQILTLSQTLASGGNAMPTLIVYHNGDLAIEARRLGIPVRVVGARGLVDLRSIRKLQRILHAERINAISLHGYRASVYLALSLAGQRINVVKTEHGGIEAAGERLSERLRPQIYRWLENVATRQLGAQVVYVTRELQALCKREHAKLQRHVIYNGIAPLDRTSTTRPPEFRTGMMNLVAVGRLERVKGLDVAIRALANPAMPSLAHLYLVGSGPELERLTALARELDVAARVSFLGFREQVYDYIAHADALLMPSHHEGLPYTLLEALSLGTPVVASRVGGLAEVLTSEESALLVEPRDPEGIARAVLALAEVPELGEKLARNGRSLIASQFTADEMARRYLSLFDAGRLTRAQG